METDRQGINRSRLRGPRINRVVLLRTMRESIPVDPATTNSNHQLVLPLRLNTTRTSLSPLLFQPAPHRRRRTAKVLRDTRRGPALLGELDRSVFSLSVGLGATFVGTESRVGPRTCRLLAGYLHDPPATCALLKTRGPRYGLDRLQPESTEQAVRHPVQPEMELVRRMKFGCNRFRRPGSGVEFRRSLGSCPSGRRMARNYFTVR